MKIAGMFVAVFNKSGSVYEIALNQQEKDSILYVIQQIQNSKNIKVVQKKFPFKIDIKKVKN